MLNADNNSDEDMAEDQNVRPGTFNGRPDENPGSVILRIIVHSKNSTMLEN